MHKDTSLPATTVTLHGRDKGFGLGLVASFPRSLRIARDASMPDIAILDGRSDWVQVAEEQLRRGIRRVLLIDPSPTEAERAELLLERFRSHNFDFCAVDAFSGNSAIRAFRERMHETFDEIVLEVKASGDIATLVLSCLRVLDAIGLKARKVDSFVSNGLAFVGETWISVTGAQDDHASLVRMSGAVCNVEAATFALRARRADADLSVELSDLAPGFPARVIEASHLGIRQLPPIYEGSARNALREMLKVNGSGDNDQLGILVEQMRVIKSLL